MARKTLMTLVLVLWLLLAIGWGAFVSASQIVLKDGRVLEGEIGRLTNMLLKPNAGPPPEEGAPDPMLIVFVDDNLRRRYVPKQQIQSVNENAAEPTERFRIKGQLVARSGSKVAQMGPILDEAPFDEFGHRTLEIMTVDGRLPIFEGITEITPLWTRVQGLDVPNRKNIVIDQRLATSSLPRELLSKLLHRQSDPNKLSQRLRLVRFYLLAERYKDAQTELEEVLADFPNARGELAPRLRELKQAYAQKALAEIQLRRDAGQIELSRNLLAAFPTDGVAGETLQSLRQMQDDFKAEDSLREQVIQLLREHQDLLKEAGQQQRVTSILQEVTTELNRNNIGRLAAYRQFSEDANIDPSERLRTDEKLALAISGWLVGTNDATRRLPLALSLVEVRKLVREYLNEPIKVKRDQILQKLVSREGSTPQLVARILAFMKPPDAMPPLAGEVPGMFLGTVDGLDGQPQISYLIQVPPQYDPHRLYPAVVTLHGAGSTPAQQIDWWAGPRGASGMRMGHATRHGYIVIAPKWTADQQKEYRYSAEEFAAVWHSLRDACRRFSIDTDRVFLSGHSIGGDAAWDIGLAHPDLWAGVIPITATGERYVEHYATNARHLPLYFVGGELDGNKAVTNGPVIDRYMKWGYPVTVVEYLGRGHEHFSDEILDLFDWMGRWRRDFARKKFAIRSMRDWDRFYWWVELEDFPEKTTVHPDDWPPPRGTRPAQTSAKITLGNTINVRTAADRVVLWLSPELVDLAAKLTITVNGGKLRMPDPFVEADLHVLLEDARLRSDRQHPFWAKVEMPTGKINTVSRRVPR